ncbi:MAG: quinolinate synthase NadA [Anaerolineae bacterium]|nr:quinolinate synthase NadA [Anaerolineae bacterium]
MSESASQQISNLQSLIATIKSDLGDQLVILGHHYQRDDVIQFADFRGDSLKLARDAAKCVDAKYIVFCGVHFMAETADILSQPDQAVLLPDLKAGCPLAEMANRSDVEEAWAQLGKVMDVEGEVLPITYVNSSAALKAFCGQHGGSVCTSSNAASVLAWAFERRRRVLFFPDQHLGRNTAKKMGIPLEEMALWNPSLPLGGNDVEALKRARVFLWRGFCNVHQRFKPEHVTAWRERDPEIRVIVHPECEMAVVDLADEAGSTATIIKRVEESPPGTRWAIGTEANLVNRLKHEHLEQVIDHLSSEPSYCRTMNLITLEKLARVMEGLAEGEITNQVTVPDDVARDARVALERMLEAS